MTLGEGARTAICRTIHTAVVAAALALLAAGCAAPPGDAGEAGEPESLAAGGWELTLFQTEGSGCNSGGSTVLVDLAAGPGRLEGGVETSRALAFRGDAALAGTVTGPDASLTINDYATSASLLLVGRQTGREFVGTYHYTATPCPLDEGGRFVMIR